ncbi:DUF6194 family protein [Actinomadura napierensis]|uniref:DUF6194 domain-containing protein n=1 Tax=Actinomadura napierensis TaxID=267854 RepID=A0ABN2ZHY5_9ACTN
MSIDEILEFVGGFDGVLVLRPQPGDGSPEIAWGDAFVYYAPDGNVPKATQPYATIVTKDYPGDERSRLDRPGAFRLNIAAGKDASARWAGREPDPSAADVLMAHPVYGSAGWLAVVNPGASTETAVRELLRTAHDLARSRYERRSPAGHSPAG